VACLDEPPGDPGLGDRLARAGGADDERVPAAGVAERDAHGAAALVAPHRQPLAVDPPAAAQAAALDAGAGGVERAAAEAGVLGAVAAVPEVVLVPARPGRRREHGGGGGEPRCLLVEGPQQRPQEDAEQRPGPVQAQPPEERDRGHGDQDGGADR
jgi:hypothetical protein